MATRPGFSTSRRILLIVVLVAGHALAFRSAFIASRDMVTGDGSLSQLRPGPRYAPLRVPDNPVSRRFEAEHRLGADFAQIYFPARVSGGAHAFSADTADPWGRESRCAPFVHWACAVSICRLPYGWSSWLHLVIQYAVFLVSLVYAFYALRLWRYLPATLLAVHVGLFLTPVGLSWFERGQYSLYVASAYLWLFLGMYKERASWLALAALFAYVKWTSFPMLFVGMGVWLLMSPTRPVLVTRLRLVLAPVSLVVALFGIFPKSGLEFVYGLMSQEGTLAPDGLSLARLIPRGLAKAVPFGLVAFGVIRARAGSLTVEHMVPFWLGAGVLLLLYPTLAYDYSVPCLFGLIPFALDWARRHRARGDAWLVPALFFLFLAVASTVKIADVLAADVDIGLICGYVACAALLLAWPFADVFTSRTDERAQVRARGLP